MGRAFRRAAAGSLAVLVAACSDPSGGTATPLPAFVFSSDAEGARGIYLWEDSVVTRLSTAGREDGQPHSAAGRIVFRSRRDGNGEIYIADTALAGQQRLTTDPWDDTAPALSPTGSQIAFISNRSGTPRLWVMDADGANQRAVATGSSAFVPEGSPSWQPTGGRIAFTSTRTGTSQVFTMDVAGGAAVQLTREATGAFQPSWSSDGKSVIFTTLSGGSSVRVMPLTGVESQPLAAGDSPLSQGRCLGRWCLAVAGTPGDGGRGILSVSRIGREPRAVTTTGSDDAEPAFLVR